ncbi:MAG TPA: hypothetical protein PLT68_04495 [Actinomycetota bacterium]|nr:hypothetical protein [Actinomycetota bacterium]
MRRFVAPIAAIALALPVAPAIAKPSPPGGTLVLTVRGVPKRAKATIVLKGPKHSRRVVKTHGNHTVRHQRPGTYRITPKKLITPQGIRLGKAKPGKASVTERKTARVRVVYSALTVPVKPPADEAPESPPTPFPGALAPASVVLISQTPAGTPADKRSGDPAWPPRRAVRRCQPRFAHSSIDQRFPGRGGWPGRECTVAPRATPPPTRTGGARNHPPEYTR